MRGVAVAVLGVLCVAGFFGPTAHAAQADPAEAAAAADLKPEDFAYGMNMLRSSDAAAYRVPLPLAVYQTVVHADLGDVRVFNERDEMVPYRIERPRSQSTVRAAPVALPVFPLRSDSREALDAIRLTIESRGTRVDVQTPATSHGAAETHVGAKSAASGPAARYIIDGRALQLPIAGLQLTWPDDAPDFAGRLRVEASEDLGSWRTVVTGAPVANLRAGEARILERRVELAGVTAKFWRLSWADAPAPFAITSVVAEAARDHVDLARATLTVAGTTVPGKRGEFEFDLGAQAPVDRVNLELPEQNSIVEVEFLSRARPDAPWQPAVRGGFYRLKSTRPTAMGRSTSIETEADLTNSSLSIRPTPHRYWLARVDTRGGGLGRGVPRLHVGWLPHEVVFLARGAGPFTLAYGSSKVHAAAALGAIPPGVSIESATLAEPVALGGDARLAPAATARVFWSKSTVLWTVLGIGVALLALMAYRLARELK